MNLPEIGSVWKFKNLFPKIIINVLEIDGERVTCWIENGINGNHRAIFMIQEFYDECEIIERLPISQLRKKIDALKKHVSAYKDGYNISL